MSIHSLQETKLKSDAIFPYHGSYKKSHIIIDNGSFCCRVGWSTSSEPCLVYRNCYAKQRKDRTKKNVVISDADLVANDIGTLESNKFQLKFPHDENVVTHFEGQETMLDYAFTHLGINTESVNHAIIMTESLSNPNYSRQCMSELLFEGYGVPKVTYCVDGLLSYNRHYENIDGIIINVGNWTTHIMPVLNRRVDYEKCRRIHIGGHHLTKHLSRLLQLRFPQHLNSIYLSRAEEILFNYMHVAEDYSESIKLWTNSSYYEENLKKIQLPFNTHPVSIVATPEQQKERRKVASKRLAEMNAKRREEKLDEDLHELSRLTELEGALEEFSPEEAEYQHALEEAEVNSLNELQKRTRILQQRIDKTKQKILQSVSGTKDEEPEFQEVKTLKLKQMSVPDNAEDKRFFLENQKQEWHTIQFRKTSRRRKRLEMARRRTIASQERMRIITKLAKRDKKEDDFGMRDEDWDVYKAISKDGGGSDSEEDNEKLQNIETVLKHYSPEFFSDDTAPKQNSVAENYQFYISTEQIQVPELLFQPSINGTEQGGISDTLQYVFSLYNNDLQLKLANNVFVTGGGAQIPGLIARIRKDLTAMRPYQSVFNIVNVDNPSLDAWYGACKFSSELAKSGVTYKEYMEYGGDYIHDNILGNKWWQPQIPRIEPNE